MSHMWHVIYSIRVHPSGSISYSCIEEAHTQLPACCLLSSEPRIHRASHDQIMHLRAPTHIDACMQAISAATQLLRARACILIIGVYPRCSPNLFPVLDLGIMVSER